MKTKQEEVTPSGGQPEFTPLHVSAHGYDSPYLVKAFIEDDTGRPVCGLYEGDGPLARLFAAAPEMHAFIAQIARMSKDDECAACGLVGDDEPYECKDHHLFEYTINDTFEIVDSLITKARELCAALALVDEPQETKQ